MKCDKCNHDSSFEIHFYDGEKHRVMNLCKECYEKHISEIFPNTDKGMDFNKFVEFIKGENGRAFTELLKDTLNIKINFDIMNKSENENKSKDMESNVNFDKEDRCPNCFKSLDEILEDKKFGCSECYTTFKDKLDEDFVRKMAQKDDSKVEDIEQNKEIKVLVKKIEEKQEALKDFISTENYEKAALLRDEINKLKTDLNNLK